jgi:peptide/nickel transport system permease protein
VAQGTSPLYIPEAVAVRGPTWWQRLRRSRVAWSASVFLTFLTLALLLADVLSPYSETRTNRTTLYHPPTKVHWRDEQGRLSHPYVYLYKQTDYILRQYVEDVSAGKHYLKLFWRGEPYRLCGLITTDIHLFGVDSPAVIYLLGADGLGRDVFSRLLHGGRRSLFICVAAVLLSCLIGWACGGLAGYFGGRIDFIILNSTSTLLCIPSMYLLIVLTAYLPPDMGSRSWLMIAGLVLVNSPYICYTARNCVMHVRRQPYLEAARAVGAGNLHIILYQVLPNCLWLAWMSMTLYLPRVLLGESSLSILGIGIQEPYATWGGMLSEALNLMVLVRFPWLLVPGVAIILAVLCWSIIAETLHVTERST